LQRDDRPDLQAPFVFSKVEEASVLLTLHSGDDRFECFNYFSGPPLNGSARHLLPT